MRISRICETQVRMIRHRMLRCEKQRKSGILVQCSQFTDEESEMLGGEARVAPRGQDLSDK